MRTQNQAIVALLGIAVGMASASSAVAQSVEDFYRDKTITMWIGYSPGGGYDTYARTVIRHMGKYIPGNPKFVAKNRPGAGSMLLANELFNVMPSDGTAVGIVGRGQVMEPLFGTAEAKFDPSEFVWLGSANNEVSICVSWHETDIKTLDDFLTMTMIVGGTGPGADTDTFPEVLNNVIGTNLKLVTGYPGGNDILLAMERGEVDGRCGYSWSSAKSRKADWIRDNKMNILMQMSTAKHPDLPDVPFVMDLAKTERDKQILGLIFARQAWGRPFMAPPGVPEDRAKALQVAFMATMEDPEFLADAKKQNLEIAPIDGATIGTLITDLYASPKDVIEAAKVAAEKVENIEITKLVIPEQTVQGVISELRNGGRELVFTLGGDTIETSVSGSRTTITVAGAAAERDNLAVGMTCDFTYLGPGTEAKVIACQ